MPICVLEELRKTGNKQQKIKKKFLIFLKLSQEAFNHNILNKPTKCLILPNKTEMKKRKNKNKNIYTHLYTHARFLHTYTNKQICK